MYPPSQQKRPKLSVKGLYSSFTFSGSRSLKHAREYASFWGSAPSLRREEIDYAPKMLQSYRMAISGKTLGGQEKIMIHLDIAMGFMPVIPIVKIWANNMNMLIRWFWDSLRT